MPEDMLPMGVNAVTGELLPGLDLTTAAMSRVATLEVDAPTRTRQTTNRAAIEEIDDQDLACAGWGVLFAAEDPRAGDVEAALWPLLQRREEAAGGPYSSGGLYKVFKGTSGYQYGDRASTWLARQAKDLGLGLVNPRLGIPNYLLLVGGPETIPFEFQYDLDLYWAVGRVLFDDVLGYSNYAKSVVEFEMGGQKQAKRLALFSTCHGSDRATQMFRWNVAHRLVTGADHLPPVGKSQGFSLDPIMAEHATKQSFTDVLCGRRDGGVPALIFSGTHGAEFPLDDKRQDRLQGALICQGWRGYGPLGPDDWFSADDVPPDAKLSGMILFLFACYSGGYGRVDTFRDGASDTGRQIASASRVASLPQALLGHANGGALAVLAHVDRAWAYTFRHTTGGTQTEGLRDVLVRLMKGHRIGSAVDRFNMRWAAIATELSDLMRNSGAALQADRIAKLWVARDDARNYIVLGDPAVRLSATQ